MATSEQLVPPSPRSRFSFWGASAALVLPEGLPEVLFEYLTEPPHGDPLYRVTVDRIKVGGSKNPIPFFARDLHLSECSRFLALTSLTERSAFHVIDLANLLLWSKPGLVRIEDVSATALTFRRYRRDGHNVKPGELESAPFESGEWLPLARGTAY